MVSVALDDDDTGARTYSISPQKTPLSDRLRFEHVTIVDSDPLDWLWYMSLASLSNMSLDFVVQLREERFFELGECLCGYATKTQSEQKSRKDIRAPWSNHIPLMKPASSLVFAMSITRVASRSFGFIRLRARESLIAS